MRLHKIIASVAGVGNIKGGGTIAAVIYCIVWFCLPAGLITSAWQVIITATITLVGIWSSNVVEADWGKDSSKVVIDEVAGMAVSLLFVPQQIIFLLSGLILFRFFDIVKPLGVLSMEKFPGGWGVMADDLLAGVYSWAVLQLLVFVCTRFT